MAPIDPFVTYVILPAAIVYLMGYVVCFSILYSEIRKDYNHRIENIRADYIDNGKQWTDSELAYMLERKGYRTRTALIESAFWVPHVRSTMVKKFRQRRIDKVRKHLYNKETKEKRMMKAISGD